MPGDWSEYYAASKTKPLHPLFAELESFAPRPQRVLDLGCGVGHAAGWALARGASVVAVDADAEAVRLCAEAHPPATVWRAGFEDLGFGPATFDLVIAQFSLFFLPPASFAAVWPRVVGWLAPGGLFMGQFLGINDDWRSRGYTVHTADQVATLLTGFEVLHLQEDDRDGQTMLGDAKHWHIFHTIAQKRG